MDHPARTGAESRPEPAGRPEYAVMRAMITQAEACARAVAALAGRPDDDGALAMARLCVTVLENLGDAARGWGFAAGRLEALVAERVEEELAARGARRGALHAVPAFR